MPTQRSGGTDTLMSAWAIYYADGSVVRGQSAAEWRAAPDDAVQVVVSRVPPAVPRWHSRRGVVRDRQLWTGADEYDPFGWGVKRGTLIDDAAYAAVWEKACGDD